MRLLGLPGLIVMSGLTGEKFVNYAPIFLGGPSGKYWRRQVLQLFSEQFPRQHALWRFAVHGFGDFGGAAFFG